MDIGLLRDVTLIIPANSPLIKLLGAHLETLRDGFIFYDREHGGPIVAPDASHKLLDNSKTIPKTTAEARVSKQVPAIVIDLVDENGEETRVVNEEDMADAPENMKQITRLLINKEFWWDFEENPVVPPPKKKKDYDHKRWYFPELINVKVVRLLYIYLSNIDDTFVGSSEKPLLRILGIEGLEHGQIRQMTFESGFFIPVYSNYLDRLSVKIADEYGQVVKFKSSCTLLLEIRPVQ